MRFSRFFIIFILLCTTQVFAMKRTARIVKPAIDGSGFFGKRSFVSNIKPLTTKSFWTNNRSLAATMQMQSSKKRFSTSQFVYGVWDNFHWHFKSREQKRKDLFKALAQKIEYNQSASFSELTLEQLIAKISNEGLINAVSEGNHFNPLRLAIYASPFLPEPQQEKIIQLLLDHGADAHDHRALCLSVKQRNIGALKLLQPNFKPGDLYEYYVEAQDAIEVILNNLSHGDFKTIHELEKYKKILTILSQPCTKATYQKGEYINLNDLNRKFYDEQIQETITTDSCEEFYIMMNKHKKSSYYQWQQARQNSQSNYHSSYEYQYSHHAAFSQKETDETVQTAESYDPTKYHKPQEQELYKFFVKLKRKNLRPEELLELTYPASKSAIKASSIKYIQQYHPDHFHHNEELLKMATEVTKVLNSMRR